MDRWIDMDRFVSVKERKKIRKWEVGGLNT